MQAFIYVGLYAWTSQVGLSNGGQQRTSLFWSNIKSLFFFAPKVLFDFFFLNRFVTIFYVDKCLDYQFMPQLAYILP